MRYSSSDLLGYAVLTLTLHLNRHVQAACKDSQGQTYNTGVYYVPGPEPCTLCVCDHGNPKWCKAVICQLPEKSMQKQGCKSFRFGTACCEFICLDDNLSSVSNDKTDGSGGNATDPSANYDWGLRLGASCITTIFSLSLLFFLIHRLRQRKIRAGRQSRQLAEDQRSLGSMGYLERGGLPRGVQLDDMACGGGYPLWKPPGNYFPRGEAPPPYEEAVAAARAEQALLTISPHALSPLNLPNQYLTTHNSHASVSLVNAGQTGLAASSPTPSSHAVPSTSPSISSSGRPLSAPNAHANFHHSSNPNDNLSQGVYNGTSTTSFTMGSSTYENLPNPIAMSITPQHSCLGPQDHQQQQMQQMHQSQHHQQQQQLHQQQNNALQLAVPQSKTYHTTLPRQGTAFTISATLPSSSVSTHRTIPRTLATSGNLRLRQDFMAHQQVATPLFATPPRNLSPGRPPRSAPPVMPSSEQNSIRSDAFYEDMVHGPPSAPPQLESKPIELPATSLNHFDAKPPLLARADSQQDGSFDSVTCTCSMQALPTIHDDADDYRSECENCKSATGSRYYLDNEDELVTSPHETMTLHRRPEETAANVTPQYYRTSLTLPTSTRQRTRSTGTRGNWFSSMPESSTESSDDD